MSPPEVAVWLQLRKLKSRGWHFRRQSPEGPYFLDFVCRQARLVVEVDGIHHSGVSQSDHDKDRDAYLKERGFRVLRFWARDVMDELEGVLATILAELGDAPSPARSVPRPQKVGGRYGQLVRMGLRRRSDA